MSDPKRETEELRQEIAKIDGQLLATVERRARLARRIGELRRDQPPVTLVEDRAALNAIVNAGTGELPKEALFDIFRTIHSSCFGLQTPLTVAYLGPEGGLTHAAARDRFGPSTLYVPHETIAAALDDVVRGRAPLAVVPLETQADGSVPATLAALTVTDLKITAAMDAPAALHLMNKTGNPADIEKLYATAEGRAHMLQFLAARPRIAVVDVRSPMVACQFAAEDHGAAALVPERFGIQHDLEVAQRSVLDDPDGKVRYAVVGARPSARTGEDVTTFAFSVNDAPGALLDVLQQFAERGINLTKIESRPVRGTEWSYFFYVEVLGHATDRQLIAAFEDVRRASKFFKVLGSYPALV
jgi:chorismate mutase/prephenate dehydratase